MISFESQSKHDQMGGGVSLGPCLSLLPTSDDAAFITGQAIVVDGGQYRIG
jgi:hypothetical protein